ncbi:MAG: hypothetical protein LBU84_04045 [Prevotella sp.]|jgi:hypothetical protein|nr:hypothetical protein [Prevotella sp.]
MKNLMKVFFFAMLFFSAHSVFAQQSIIKDILDPVRQVVINTQVGSTVSVDVKVTDVTGSLLSNLLSVQASLNNASNNFRIKNVQQNVQNYLISFQVEYTATEEGEDIADISLEANINLLPFIPVSKDLVRIKVIVD